MSLRWTCDEKGAFWFSGHFPELSSWDYGYDSASNALSAAHAGDSMNQLESTQHYDYDTLNRLVSARVTDTQDWTAAAEETTSYQYDDLGNRQSHSYRDATAIAYGHDKANRMTDYAGLTQGYDLAGNLTLAFSADRGTSYTYRYDHHNRLEAVCDPRISRRIPGSAVLSAWCKVRATRRRTLGARTRAVVAPRSSPAQRTPVDVG